MKIISILIKPSSSLCNLRCRYCFYLDESENRCIKSYGVMDHSTVDKLIERILEVVKDDTGVINISFQGGEPTVARLEYFKYFTDSVAKHKNLKPNYSLQTNGTLIDEKWAEFFKENNFLVGISLDGFKENTNKFRLDLNNNGMYDRIIKGIDILENYGCDYNILTVLTRQLAEEPEKLLNFYIEKNFKYIQLIPCLPELNKEDNGMSLTPNEYADFYIRFFEEWKKEVLKGNIISINLFDNIVSMLTGRPPYQCGMIGKCSAQFVVESNGDVYPCDFYCLDENRLGNINNQDFNELYKRSLASFVSHSSCSKKICETCTYKRICNGGCRRQNVCYLNEDSCAYKLVLEHIVPELINLIKQQKI